RTVGVEGVHAPFRSRCGPGGVDDDERLVGSGRIAQFLTGAVVVGVGLQLLQADHTIVGVDDVFGGAVGPGDDDREVRMFLASPARQPCRCRPTASRWALSKSWRNVSDRVPSVVKTLSGLASACRISRSLKVSVDHSPAP